MRISSLFTAAVALPLACAPPSTTAGSHSSNIISREEIAGAHVTNAYDAVTVLRPTFLRFHGHTSIQKDTLCSTASSGYVSCKAPTEAGGRRYRLSADLPQSPVLRGYHFAPRDQRD